MTKQDSATETNTEDPLPINLRTESSGCFVCGPDNPIGLKVVFDIEDGKCIGEFVAKKEHSGFRNITHGGILFSLLDDVMANFLWLQGEQCFTARADIRYRDQLEVGQLVRLISWCEKRKGRLAQMRGEIVRLSDQVTVAEASGTFMLTAEQSRD